MVLKVLKTINACLLSNQINVGLVSTKYAVYLTISVVLFIWVWTMYNGYKSTALGVYTFVNILFKLGGEVRSLCLDASRGGVDCGESCAV